jgi:multidrug efflux pump subunit AcrA (membrane-fusion protein)
LRKLAIVFLCMSLIGSTARAESPTTAASQPDDTTAVARGTIIATVEVDGYLEPIDPVEVRIRPESYQGDLKVKSVVNHGATVHSGDVILSIDPTELQRQIAEADNALTNAKANLAKAEADDYLGEQADALALEQARTELANAEGSLKWWEEVDGKQMLTMAELSTRNSKANVEDQNDELEQLRKMYKTEELTNATADIVVKRALRQLEQSKIMAGISELREGKVKNFDYLTSRQRLVFSIESEKQQLAALKAAQEQQRILRKTAVASARMVVDKADKKVNELRADLEAMTVHAPSEGVVYFGQISNGSWQNSGPKAIRVGEKAQAGQVVMTLVRPGKLRLIADIPEAKLNWLAQGSEARVVPVALPEATVTARCADVSPTPSGRDGGQGFQARFDLPSADPKLLPGMKASVRIDAGTVSDVLVIPAGAVSKGRVKVKEDGKEVWRDVVTGKSDGDNVEIKQGLKEGELVVTKGGK